MLNLSNLKFQPIQNRDFVILQPFLAVAQAHRTYLGNHPNLSKVWKSPLSPHAFFEPQTII